MATKTSELWSKATLELDSDTYQEISAFQSGELDVLRHVLIAAAAKRDTAIGSRWTYKRIDGKMVIIRDVLEKVVSCIDRYTGAIDVAANADPIHVGLPWAMIKVILQVCNHCEPRGIIVLTRSLGTGPRHTGFRTYKRGYRSRHRGLGQILDH